jgi:glutathione-specific gamma-glutamylcyclotransferase
MSDVLHDPIDPEIYPRRFRETPRVDLPAGDLWVFGYGSLMWNPGFPYSERHMGRLYGFHRARCMWSWVYRGTEEHPGLVLGLDRGGSCVGRVFRVAETDRPRVLDYLYRRELTSESYDVLVRPVHVTGSRSVPALVFAANRSDPQYAGRLGLEACARHVLVACGERGPNRDYVVNTVLHLDELGIIDPLLHRLCDRLLEPEEATRAPERD